MKQRDPWHGPNIASIKKDNKKKKANRVFCHQRLKKNVNSPHGVVGPLPDPVRHRAILLQLLAQLALDDKRLVGTLHREVSNL